MCAGHPFAWFTSALLSAVRDPDCTLLSAVQILTAQQSAKAMVYAYPFPAQPEVMLNQLAADREEPSMQALLDDTSVDDFQHDANWQDLSRYLASITMQNVQAHVPLLSE